MVLLGRDNILALTLRLNLDCMISMSENSRNDLTAAMYNLTDVTAILGCER
jgi:hypothetical protein